MTNRPPVIAGMSAVLIALAGLTGLEYVIWALRAIGLLSGVSQYPFLIVAQGMLFALPALLYYRSRPGMIPAMRLAWLDPLSAVLIALAAAIGALALNQLSVFWLLLLDTLGLTTDLGGSLIPYTIQQLMLMFLVVSITPAIFEEILFRGLVLPSLETLGPRRAILLSGIIFTLVHRRVEALPTHLLLGCVLGLLVLQTGSLYAGILFHAVYNAVILFLGYLSTQYVPQTLNALPTLESAIQSIPMMLFLFILWALLLYGGISRGKKKQRAPLPPAEVAPLSSTARTMLIVSFALLILLEASSLLSMLPGSGL